MNGNGPKSALGGLAYTNNYSATMPHMSGGHLSHHFAALQANTIGSGSNGVCQNNGSGHNHQVIYLFQKNTCTKYWLILIQKLLLTEEILMNHLISPFNGSLKPNIRGSKNHLEI